MNRWSECSMIYCYGIILVYLLLLSLIWIMIYVCSVSVYISIKEMGLVVSIIYFHLIEIQIQQRCKLRNIFYINMLLWVYALFLTYLKTEGYQIVNYIFSVCSDITCVPMLLFQLFVFYSIDADAPIQFLLFLQVWKCIILSWSDFVTLPSWEIVAARSRSSTIISSPSFRPL